MGASTSTVTFLPNDTRVFFTARAKRSANIPAEPEFIPTEALRRMPIGNGNKPIVTWPQALTTFGTVKSYDKSDDFYTVDVSGCLWKPAVDLSGNKWANNSISVVALLCQNGTTSLKVHKRFVMRVSPSSPSSPSREATWSELTDAIRYTPPPVVCKGSVVVYSNNGWMWVSDSDASCTTLSLSSLGTENALYKSVGYTALRPNNVLCHVSLTFPGVLLPASMPKYQATWATDQNSQLFSWTSLSPTTGSSTTIYGHVNKVKPYTLDLWTGKIAHMYTMRVTTAIAQPRFQNSTAIDVCEDALMIRDLSGVLATIAREAREVVFKVHSQMLDAPGGYAASDGRVLYSRKCTVRRQTWPVDLYVKGTVLSFWYVGTSGVVVYVDRPSADQMTQWRNCQPQLAGYTIQAAEFDHTRTINLQTLLNSSPPILDVPKKWVSVGTTQPMQGPTSGDYLPSGLTAHWDGEKSLPTLDSSYYPPDYSPAQILREQTGLFQYVLNFAFPMRYVHGVVQVGTFVIYQGSIWVVNANQRGTCDLVAAVRRVDVDAVLCRRPTRLTGVNQCELVPLSIPNTGWPVIVQSINDAEADNRRALLAENSNVVCTTSSGVRVCAQVAWVLYTYTLTWAATSTASYHEHNFNSEVAFNLNERKMNYPNYTLMNERLYEAVARSQLTAKTEMMWALKQGDGSSEWLASWSDIISPMAKPGQAIVFQMHANQTTSPQLTTRHVYSPKVQSFYQPRAIIPAWVELRGTIANIWKASDGRFGYVVSISEPLIQFERTRGSDGRYINLSGGIIETGWTVDWLTDFRTIDVHYDAVLFCGSDATSLVSRYTTQIRSPAYAPAYAPAYDMNKSNLALNQIVMYRGLLCCIMGKVTSENSPNVNMDVSLVPLVYEDGTVTAFTPNVAAQNVVRSDVCTHSDLNKITFSEPMRSISDGVSRTYKFANREDKKRRLEHVALCAVETQKPNPDYTLLNHSLISCIRGSASLTVGFRYSNGDNWPRKTELPKWACVRYQEKVYVVVNCTKNCTKDSTETGEFVCTLRRVASNTADLSTVARLVDVVVPAHGLSVLSSWPRAIPKFAKFVPSRAAEENEAQYIAWTDCALGGMCRLGTIDKIQFVITETQAKTFESVRVVYTTKPIETDSLQVNRALWNGWFTHKVGENSGGNNPCTPGVEESAISYRPQWKIGTNFQMRMRVTTRLAPTKNPGELHDARICATVIGIQLVKFGEDASGNASTSTPVLYNPPKDVKKLTYGVLSYVDLLGTVSGESSMERSESESRLKFSGYDTSGTLHEWSRDYGQWKVRYVFYCDGPLKVVTNIAPHCFIIDEDSVAWNADNKTYCLIHSNTPEGTRSEWMNRGSDFYVLNPQVETRPRTLSQKIGFGILAAVGVVVIVTLAVTIDLAPTEVHEFYEIGAHAAHLITEGGHGETAHGGEAGTTAHNAEASATAHDASAQEVEH
jgi:hypothetical protein